jgi:nucleoside diphosphate kinase
VIMERTFVMLKPDTVKRGLVGNVIGRFERVGLEIAAMKMIKLTSKQVEDFYPKDEAWLTMLGKKVVEAFKFRGENAGIDELEQGNVPELVLAFDDGGEGVALAVYQQVEPVDNHGQVVRHNIELFRLVAIGVKKAGSAGAEGLYQRFEIAARFRAAVNRARA